MKLAKTEGKLALFLSVFFLLTACDTQSPVSSKKEELKNRGALSSVRELSSFAAPALVQSFRASTNALAAREPRWKNVNAESVLTRSLKAYKIVYDTTYKGSPTPASAVVLVPQQNLSDIKVMLDLHGTIFSTKEAPSIETNSQAWELYKFFSSQGMVLVAPDYLGYGDSTLSFPPYAVKKEMVSTAEDTLTALRSFFEQDPTLSKIYNTNKSKEVNLFLSGFSQGGLNALYLHSAFQAQPPTGYALRATASGAGVYDLTNSMRIILQAKDKPAEQVTYSQLITFSAYLAYQYSKYYSWSTDDFFTTNFTPLLTYFSSKHDPGVLETKLQQYYQAQGALGILPLQATFNTAFIEAGSKHDLTHVPYKNFFEKLKENSELSFIPTKPFKIVQGNTDNISLKTVVEPVCTALKGKASSLVTCVYPAIGHSPEAFYYEAHDWFKTF